MNFFLVRLMKLIALVVKAECPCNNNQLGVSQSKTT